MDEIKGFALSVCVTSVLSGVLLHLLPDTQVRKSAGIVCVLLICLLFIGPLAREEGMHLNVQDAAVGDIEQSILAQSEALDGEVLRYVKEELINELKSEACKEGIDLADADIRLNAANVSQVNVEHICLFGSFTGAEKRKLTEISHALFTTEVTVSFEE